MQKKKNRRTLRKRIRRMLTLSTSVTVLFQTFAIIALLITVSQIFLDYQTDTVTKKIQNDIDSGRAIKLMKIDSMESLTEFDTRATEWIELIDKTSMINEVFSYYNFTSDAYIEIKINDTIIYSNFEKMDDLTKKSEIEGTESPIYDKEGNEIGYIKVVVSPMILVGIMAPAAALVFLLGLIAFMISRIFSHFFAIPIIAPINQLNLMVKAIAEENQEASMNTKLVLKKPLQEIEALADSTNQIMKNFHQYYNQLEHQKQILENHKLALENQKDTLENQNTELELQNEELINSKFQIQQQQGQLIQSEKMASIGMLTAAITHEINTPIGAINSNAQLGDMVFTQLINHPVIQADEELNAMFTQLKELNDVNVVACKRISEIIKSLKSYSRLDQADFQEADVVDGIKNVLVLTHNLLKNRITVHEEYESIPLVKCFPGQLNQVFMNIIVNASQAIEGEGDIFIHTYQKDRELCISIKDTGTGIALEDIPKIFEPGFTTKGVGVGLGLGLYLSYNIIKNHKGYISVTSEPGKGAEFIVSIPMDINRT